MSRLAFPQFGSRLRLLAWAGLTAAAAAVFYRPSVDAVVQVALHPTRVVDQRMVHAWGVLALCAGALWLKRGAVRAALPLGAAPWSVAFGAGCLVASSWLFPPAGLLAGAVGLFALLLGRAVRWPAALFGIYLVGAGFPALVERVADAPVGLVTATAAGGVVRLLGNPLVLAGQFVTLQDSSGQVIRVLINASCAGPATMGVFMALFALMWLDVPLPWRPAALLFAVGFAGTWLQNVGRLVYLLLVAHHQGEAAMWAAHNDSGYLWFIGWYAVFGLVYLSLAARRGAARPRNRPPAALRTAVVGA